MKSDNDLISNSKIYLFCNILILIGTLGLLPIYSKFLSPSDWGVVGIFLLFGQTLLGIISFGVPRASYYFKFKVSKEEFNNLQFYHTLCILRHFSQRKAQFHTYLCFWLLNFSSVLIEACPLSLGCRLKLIEILCPFLL